MENFFSLSRQANFDAIVLMAHEDSRDVRRAASELADVSTQFEGQNVGFCFIDATGETDKSGKFRKLQKMRTSIFQS